MKAELNPKKLIFFSTISVAILLLLTYFISVADGHNKLCNPFISGCSDITHAGFASYEKYMLKAVLVPTATVMAVIFFFIKEWLIQISDHNPSVIKQGRIMLFLAIVGCMGLIIGTAVIDGSKTPLQIHLKAVAVFFVLMSVCQVWYTIIEYKYSYRVNKVPMNLRRAAIAVTVAFSIWSIFMKPTYTNQSILEWWSVYALIFWFWTFSLNKRV